VPSAIHERCRQLLSTLKGHWGKGVFFLKKKDGSARRTQGPPPAGRCGWILAAMPLGNWRSGGGVDRRHDGRADRRGKARNAIGRRKRRHHWRPERCEAMKVRATTRTRSAAAAGPGQAMPIAKARAHMTWRGPLLLCHGRPVAPAGNVVVLPLCWWYWEVLILWPQSMARRGPWRERHVLCSSCKVNRHERIWVKIKMPCWLLNLYGPTEIADGDFRSFKKKKRLQMEIVRRNF